MSIELEEKVNKVKTQYNVSGAIYCDKLPGTYFEIHYKIKKNISALYNNNKDAKIIIFYERDAYDTQKLFGRKPRMIQTILNELKIDNSTVIIVTTNPDIEKEIEEVSKYTNNSGKIMFELVENGSFIRSVWTREPMPQTPLLTYV